MTHKSRKVISAVCATIISLSLVLFPFAQSPSEGLGVRSEAKQEPQQTEEERKAAKELENKAVTLINELVAEAMSLKRADSRVIFLTTVSDLLWMRDEERARALAREAMDQAVARLREAKDEAAREGARSDDMPVNRIFGVLIVRFAVLELLKNRDAKLALEFLQLTRPLAVREKQEEDLEAEKGLELALASRIAESDPQSALNIAEKYRQDKLDDRIINLWITLLAKDPKAASSLTERVIGDMKSLDLDDFDSARFVYSVLDLLRSRSGENAKARDKAAAASATRLDSEEIQRVYRDALEIVVEPALKVTAAQLDDGVKGLRARTLLAYVQDNLPDIEKHLPSRAPEVRTTLARFAGALQAAPRRSRWDEIERMMENNSPDELIAIADKSEDGEIKAALYRNAATKFIEQGDTARARRFLKDFLPNDMDSEHFFAEIERKEREQAIKVGKLEEMRKYVSRLKWSEERALAWLELARKAEASKDHKLRRESLAEAAIIMGDQMETESQVGAQLELAVAYLDLDPDRSFEILGSATDRLNTVLNAKMTSSKFQQRILTPDGVAPRDEHHGEAALAAFYDVTAAMEQRLLAFARKDFDRTALTLKRFQDDVIRLRTRLKLLETVLRSEPRQSPEP